MDSDDEKTTTSPPSQLDHIHHKTSYAEMSALAAANGAHEKVAVFLNDDGKRRWMKASSSALQAEYKQYCTTLGSGFRFARERPLLVEMMLQGDGGQYGLGNKSAHCNVIVRAGRGCIVLFEPEQVLWSRVSDIRPTGLLRFFQDRQGTQVLLICGSSDGLQQDCRAHCVRFLKRLNEDRSRILDHGVTLR